MHSGEMQKALRQQGRFFAPTRFNGRAASQAFQTAFMVGAHAVRHGIVRRNAQQHVAKLRMHKAMHEIAFRNEAAADACSHRYI